MLKSALLEQIAIDMRAARENRIFTNDYFPWFTRIRGNDLCDIIRPLEHIKTTRNWDDLYELVQEAYKIVVKLIEGGYEWNWVMPQFGAPFDAKTMQNRDERFKDMSDQELVDRQASVRLSISPQIQLRRINARGEQITELGHLAHVLLQIK